MNSPWETRSETERRWRGDCCAPEWRLSAESRKLSRPEWPSDPECCSAPTTPTPPEHTTTTTLWERWSSRVKEKYYLNRYQINCKNKTLYYIYMHLFYSHKLLRRRPDLGLDVGEQQHSVLHLQHDVLTPHTAHGVQILQSLHTVVHVT